MIYLNKSLCFMSKNINSIFISINNKFFNINFLNFIILKILISQLSSNECELPGGYCPFDGDDTLDLKLTK